MTEMVERVARAIWALYEDTDCREYNELAEHRKEYAREMARAAIAAMREPTKEMVLAGDTELENCTDSDYDSRDGSSYTTIRSDAPSLVFKAMIDEALGQPIGGGT